MRACGPGIKTRDNKEMDIRLVSLAACASIAAACSTPSEPPKTAASAPPPSAAAPAAQPAPPEPKPATPPAPTVATNTPPTPKAAPKTSPKPAPAPAAAAKPAPSQPQAQAAAATPAPPSAARPAPLDLKSLEQRLKDTGAIGVLTKLSLKNQVDDLIGRFRAYHSGVRPPTLPELRPAFELLLMKVLSLLQDKDPGLAHDIDASREAIWGVLSDRSKLEQLS